MTTEKKSRGEGDFPTGVGQPAIRALAAVGVTRLDDVTRFSAAELLALHGVGPKAISVIRAALRLRGMSLKDEDV